MKKFACWLMVVAGICAGAGAHAKTLVYCSEGSPDAFNPQLSSNGTTFDAASYPLYNLLVQIAIGTTNIEPALAESWDISPDGTVYTFRLRKGVKFHSNAKFKPTRDMNADDVLLSFNRMADPSHPFHQLANGKNFLYFEDKGLDKLIEKVEKVDDTTVRFKLRHAESPFLASLSSAFAVVLSAEYAEKMAAAGTPDALDRDPIGTGPFQFVAYQKDATIRYKAFDAYWGGRPRIDNLIFAITPDAAVRYAKLKAGECHVMAYPKPADIDVMKTDPAIKLMTREGLNVGYIALNVEKKPFDNKLVRQALNMAVDKRSILQRVFQGAGQAAKNPIPPALWSYNDGIADYPYDLAKARALLAKAGYPNGFEVDLWYLPVTRPYNPDGKRMAEMIQYDWAKIGVKARLVTYEWGEYLKRAKNGEHQAIMLGWSASGDPDEFIGPNLSCDSARNGGNRARWCNREFEELYQKAKITPKQAERTKLYLKAQEIFHEEAPWIPIAHSVLVTPVRKEVSGYVVAPSADQYFHKTDLAK